MKMDVHTLAMMASGYAKDNNVNLREAYDRCIDLMSNGDDRQPDFTTIKQYLFDWNKEHSNDEDEEG